MPIQVQRLQSMRMLTPPAQRRSRRDPILDAEGCPAPDGWKFLHDVPPSMTDTWQHKHGRKSQILCWNDATSVSKEIILWLLRHTSNIRETKMRRTSNSCSEDAVEHIIIQRIEPTAILFTRLRGSCANTSTHKCQSRDAPIVPGVASAGVEALSSDAQSSSIECLSIDMK